LAPNTHGATGSWVAGAAGWDMGACSTAGACWLVLPHAAMVLPHAAIKEPTSSEIRFHLRVSRQGRWCATAPRCQTFW
jgi:hypothetical protein